jgi:hypothetical protein
VSFHQYVSRELNLKRNVHEKNLMVPHYTGSILFCSFPLSESYCYQVLMAYNPWSICNKLTNRCGVSYRTQLEAFISSSQCPKSILLAYERATRKKCQEDKGIFKHEPTYNVDYKHDMDIEFEGMKKDEAEALKMMSLHGSNVPDDTWNLPRGVDYDWSVPNFPRDKQLWDTAETFLSDAKENLKK